MNASERLEDSRGLLRHALDALVESHERDIRETEQREPEPTEAVGRAFFDGMRDLWVLMLYAKQSERLDPLEIGALLNGLFIALDQAFREVATKSHPTIPSPKGTDSDNGR